MPEEHEELRAKRFVIVDDQGRDRIKLTTEDGGGAHVSVLPPSGKGGIQISVNEERMVLGLYAADGVSRVLLRFDADKDAATVITTGGPFLASMTATPEHATLLAAGGEKPSATVYVREDVALMGTVDKSGSKRLL